MKRIFILLTIYQTIIQYGLAQDRPLSPFTESGSLHIGFNGDRIKAFYKFFDARSESEKKENKAIGKLSGSAIVFYHGHAQRPDSAEEFTTHLVRNSRSGILIVPVCDTPFGVDSAWRGDAGKDIILMEIVRTIFKKHGIGIANYSIPQSPTVTIEGNGFKNNCDYHTSIMAIGYSHGAILARRAASKFPALIEHLIQICPAGYVKWGENSCLGSSKLLGSFLWESMRISNGYLRGYGRTVTHASVGMVRGLSGDCFRSFGSCIWGTFLPFKIFRPLLDIHDCTLYLDDSNFPVGNLKSITVIFGESDSLFRYRDIGISTPTTLQIREIENFFTTYYPSAVKNGTRLSLHVLPGNHIGLFVYPKEYATMSLLCADEAKSRLIMPAWESSSHNTHANKTPDPSQSKL
ncbi:MAG: hypothetical protein N2316_12340 [Spirochaetes bacterium]|nr:hypothetical protein [Spirochaetota bacterium]